MERCPNCRARLGEEANCRRCGLDLSRLIETEAAAERLLTQGVGFLLAGDQEAARRSLAHSRALRDTDLVRSLLGFLKYSDKHSHQG
ncbi:hypothetical protein [Allochromatium tepidum]|uniref:Zinc ribbon domain-containing protein n=1 Tax=Allochromatium tepidum TaxID=553982 RepID=A0ABN6G8C7_9GAMM|nr:hypothetical protein [Allochromatium tepidum]BCU06205.1 hypothetical protein Atep_08820 [Allochromatium tepidum]